MKFHLEKNMNATPLVKSPTSPSYKDLDLDQMKEMIRFASDEAIKILALEISRNQYEYALRLLPEEKASTLKNAVTSVRKNGHEWPPSQSPSH